VIEIEEKEEFVQTVEKPLSLSKRGLGRSPKAGRRDASPRIHPLSGERGQGDRDNKSEVNFKNRLFLQTGIYLLILLTFPYFQGFPPLKILYMYPFPLFLPLWDNYKGKFIIQLFNRCLPLYQEVLRKSALLPL